MSSRSCSCPGRLTRHCRQYPHDPERERGAEHGTSSPSSRLMPGRISVRRSRNPSPSRPLARIAPPSRAPIEAERGRIWRGGALRKQKRTQARSDECTECEPAEREHPDDEALPKAEKGEDDRERHNDPVQLCHLPCCTSSLTESPNLPPATGTPGAGACRWSRSWWVRSSAPSTAARQRPRSPSGSWPPGLAANTLAMYADIDPASQRRALGQRVRSRLPAGAAHGDGHWHEGDGQAPAGRRWRRSRSRCGSDAAVRDALARLRRARRRSRRSGRARTLVAVVDLPGPAQRRAAEPACEPAAARDAPGPRWQRAGRKPRRPGARSKAPAAHRSAKRARAVIGIVGPVPSARRAALWKRKAFRRTRSWV